MKIEKTWYESKKLWVAFLTILLLVATEVFGLNLPVEKILAIASTALGYILIQGKLDADVRTAALKKEAAVALGGKP